MSEDYSRLGVSNIFSDTSTQVLKNETVDSCNSMKNSIIHSVADVSESCSSNDVEKDDNNKKRLRLIFNNDNIYYTTYGYKDWIANADEAFFDNYMCGNRESICSKYKDFRVPYRDCWFSNYVVKNKNVSTELPSIDYPYLYPFLPYFTHSATLDLVTNNCGGSPYVYSSTDVLPNDKQEYIKKVIDSLNNSKIIIYGTSVENNTTKWTECKNIKNINIIDSEQYPNLLCPVLTGKLTCMGSLNNDGTFDPDGECK